MSELIAKWKNEIVAELSEARDALAEATAAAQKATKQHEAALSAVESVKAALARLPSLGAALALPITGRVSAVAAELDVAAMAARRALIEQNEAAARVVRLETGAAQLAAVLAAAEPAEVAA